MYVKFPSMILWNRQKVEMVLEQNEWGGNLTMTHLLEKEKKVQKQQQHQQQRVNWNEMWKLKGHTRWNDFQMG